MRPADKLQVKAAKFLPLVGLARSKQDPINRGHGAQCLYRPPPDGANCLHLLNRKSLMQARHAVFPVKMIWLASTPEFI